VNFIKRLVGLPGDRVEVHDDHLVINGETIALADIGTYNDNCYSNVRLSVEKLGEHTHEVMRCRSERGLTTIRDLAYLGMEVPATAACDRKRVAEESGGWTCLETPPEAGADRMDKSGSWKVGDDPVPVDVVPSGYFLMIGDNRDNSDDSRGWGLVPEQNLVGKATRIWFNFDSQRPTNRIVNTDRIGKKIE
jgi:signal peptidase I